MRRYLIRLSHLIFLVDFTMVMGRTKGSIAWENIIPYSGTGTAPESFKGHLTNGDNTLKGIWKLTDADKDTTGFYDDYHGHFVLHRVTGAQ